jgi:2-dehydropantoate 2-reductase
MNVGILGAGAIGCYVGGKLQAAGEHVVFVGRLGDEIAAHGLVLTDYAGAETVLAPGTVRYSADPATLENVDVILVTVKSAATESAAAPLAGKLPPRTIVVSFQNGVSNADRLRKVLPGTPVLAGMVPFNVARQGPGHFHNGTSGPLALGSDGGRERPLADALRRAGFQVDVHEDLRGLQWSKLVVNLNNAINALAGIPLREQLEDRAYRQAMAMCIREGLAVLRAEGIRLPRVGRMVPALAPFVLSLPNWAFLRLAAAMVKVDPNARSSMLDDLERGRTTEIDYLNGEIVRLGDRHHVPVPVNRKIIDLIQKATLAGQGSPRIASGALLSLLRSA